MFRECFLRKCRPSFEWTIDSKKTRHISDEEYEDGWRLACCSTVCADVEIGVPDIASAYRSRMKVADLSSKDELLIFENAKQGVIDAGISLENTMRVVQVTMEKPSLEDTMPDNERFERALKKVVNLSAAKIPIFCSGKRCRMCCVKVILL